MCFYFQINILILLIFQKQLCKIKETILETRIIEEIWESTNNKNIYKILIDNEFHESNIQKYHPKVNWKLVWKT